MATINAVGDKSTGAAHAGVLTVTDAPTIFPLDATGNYQALIGIVEFAVGNRPVTGQLYPRGDGATTS